MTLTRYTGQRLAGAGSRALDATFGRAAQLWRRGVSLIAGQESYLWSIDTDGTKVRMLDDDPDGAMEQLWLNEIIYACLRERCNAITGAAFVVEQRKDDGTYEPLPDHALARLIKRPSANIDTATLWRCLEASYTSLGKVYIEPEWTARRRELDGLMPLNPAWMREEDDGAGRLTAYRYEVPGAAPVVYAPNELITRRTVLWAAPPPLYVALGAAEADAAASGFISGFFSGGGIPSAILKTREDWSEERTNDFRAQWLRIFRPGSHLPAILGRSIESYERVGVSLNEIDNQTVRTFIETRICAAYGVSPLIIYSYAGLLRAIESNLQEAWESFWDACALPLLRDWQDWCSWSLLTVWEGAEAVRSGAVRCRFDVSGIGPYQEDVGAKVAMLHAGYTASPQAVTLNEHRLAMGLTAIDGGDELHEPEPPPEIEPPTDEGDEGDEEKALLILPPIEVPA